MRDLFHSGQPSRWLAVVALATLIAGSACGASREVPGVVAYTVDGSTLRGSWALLGGTTVGSESLLHET
ncbi:hypothetical protein BH18ACT4_BH18ACT4_00910 [soil metagenome]